MGKILVVDDDATIQALVTHAFKSTGHSLTQVPTGQDALDSVGKTAFDLILLDINLPDIQGPEILRRIREVDSNTPAVLLTREHLSSTIGPMLQLGVSSYIHKPFTPGHLRGRVSAILDQSISADTGTETGSDELQMECEFGHLLNKMISTLKIEEAEAKALLKEPYKGVWPSCKDWARKHLTSTTKLSEVPEELLHYFQFEKYVSDLQERHELFVVEYHNAVHIFHRPKPTQ